MSDAFTNALGTRQGRIEPVGFTPVGDYSMVLGSDMEGYFEHLNVGDLVQARQFVDLTGINFIRLVAKLRVPNTPGIGWRASLTVDGTPKATMTLSGGQDRERNDMAANVSKLVGVHPVGLMLEMVAV